MPNHLVTEEARKRRTRRARPVKKHHEGADGDDAMKPMMTPEVTLESTKSYFPVSVPTHATTSRIPVLFDHSLDLHLSRLVYQERNNDDSC